MTTSTPSFYPTCPNSTNTFYVCDFGSRFLGCCDFDSTAHVCNDGCANVLPASFEAQYYNDVTKNDCSDGSEWYACEFTTPTFFGCCRSNACDSDNGCPSENLTSAMLSTDAAAKAPWYPIASETSSTSSHRYTVGAVVGGVIGGVVCGFLLTFLVGGFLFYHRRKALRSKETGSDKRAKAEEHAVPVPMHTSLAESPATNVRSQSIAPANRPASRLFVANPTIEPEGPPMPISHNVNATANVRPQANAASVMGLRPSNSPSGSQELPMYYRAPEPQESFQRALFRAGWWEAPGTQTRTLAEKFKRLSGPPV
ncbi:hypothetical protein ABVK25_001908 [Lepraria finkii]|uniref:Uncharacterized protein n=1 Tax=Lepraria finkii TaxID=1340010 RepID=A0ABR4BI72_9LECA